MPGSECSADPPIHLLQSSARHGASGGPLPGQFRSAVTIHGEEVIWWRLHEDGLIDHVHLTAIGGYEIGEALQRNAMGVFRSRLIQRQADAAALLAQRMGAEDEVDHATD